MPGTAGIRFNVGDRVRMVNADRQTGRQSRIGVEFTVVRMDTEYGPRDWYVTGPDSWNDGGIYTSQLELATPIAPRTPTEVEARLAMYEAIENKTVAVHVIIEELKWVIGALQRDSAQESVDF